MPQAQQQPPLHRQPHPIAGAAEIVAVRRNKADATVRELLEAYIAGRPATLLGAVEQCVTRADKRTYLVAGTEAFTA